MKKTALILCISFLLFSCKKEDPEAEFKEKPYTQQQINAYKILKEGTRFANDTTSIGGDTINQRVELKINESFPAAKWYTYHYSDGESYYKYEQFYPYIIRENLTHHTLNDNADSIFLYERGHNTFFDSYKFSLVNDTSFYLIKNQDTFLLKKQ